jgi:hypothetical protein
MTLAEARTELSARGFDYLNPARQTLMLNDALAEIEDYWEWPWLRKTVTGAAPLQIADTASTGTPRNWWIDDTSGTPTLVAYPVGSATFTVRYESDSSTLSAPGDTPTMPSRYNRVWLDLAVALAYEDSDNFAAAAQIRGRAVQRLNQMVERYETRDMQSAPQRGTTSLSIDE